MVTMDLIEPQYLALCVFAGFVGLSILIYAIASFGMREKTYEEALAEQRARLEKENQQQHEIKQQRKRQFATRRKKEKEKPQGKSPRQGSAQEVPEDEKAYSEEEAPPTPPQNVTPRQEKPKKKEKVTPEKPPTQEKPKPVEPEIIKPSRSKRTESAPPPPPPVVEEVIQMAVEEPVLAQQEVQVEAAPPPKPQQEQHVPGKSKKTKPAGPSGDTPDAPMKGKALVNAVKTAQLKPNEIQQMMEILLAKQGGGSADDWVMANQRTDPSSGLKKQLQEKEQALHNEMLLSQSNMEKAKELKAELSQEKSRTKDLEHQYKNKLDMQNQEVEALRRRMQQTHDQHSLETQNLQTRLKQMQSIVDESSVEVVKQLRDENSRLKSDTNLAQQQKEQIMGAEMARLQGELQKMQSKVTASDKQMRQVDDMRNDFKARSTGYEATIAKMETSQREKEVTLSNTLAKMSEELQRAEAQKQSLTAEVERSKEVQRKSSEELENVKKRVADLSKSEEEKRKIIAKFEEKEKDAEYQRQGLETKVRAVESQLKENEKVKTEFTKQVEHLKQEKMNLENQIAVSVQRSEAEGQEEPAKAATNGDINMKDMISVTEHETILSEKQQKLDKLEQDITARKNEIQNLTEQIEKQRKKNDSVREKNWKAMEALSAMEKSSEENLKKSLKQLQEDLSGKLTQEQQQSKKVVQNIFPAIQVNASLAHEKWMKEFEQKAVQLLKEKDSSSDKSEELNSKISSLEADCKKYSTNIESLEMEKAELSKNVAELQYEKKQLTSQCDHYQSVLGDTEGMLNKLQSSVELEERKWEEKLASTEQLLQQAKAEVVSLQSELSSLKSKQQTSLYSQSTPDQVESDLDDTSDYHKVVSELAASKSTIEQLDKDRQSVAGELEDVKKQLTQLKDELEAANQRAESNTAGPEMEQLKQNVVEAHSAKEKLAADLQTASTTISELRSKLDAAPKGDVGALQKELEAAKEALQQAKTQSSTQLQALQKQLQDTKLALTQAETAVSEANNNSQKSVELQKELQAAKAEVEKAQGEIQKLTGELEKAKSQSSSPASEEELQSKDKKIAELSATVTEERRVKKELAIATGRLQNMLKKTQALLEAEKKTANSLRVELGKEPAAEVNSSLTDSQMEEELEAALQESIKLAKEAGVDEASSGGGGGTSV